MICWSLLQLVFIKNACEAFILDKSEPYVLKPELKLLPFLKGPFWEYFVNQILLRTFMGVPI